jgi:hypothetical protein
MSDNIEYDGDLRMKLNTPKDREIQEICRSVAQIEDNLIDLQEGNSKGKEEMVEELSSMKESLLKTLTELRAGGRE